MFVFQLVEKEISEGLVADATVQTGKQIVRKAIPQNKIGKPAKSALNGTTKIITKGKQVKKQLKKEIPQKKSYTEEPVVKDATWNIYTGNPGIYVTRGDTVNFGNVTTLSDSAFLRARYTCLLYTSDAADE